MKIKFAFIGMLCLAFSNFQLQAQCSGTYVILKMDDIRANSNGTYSSGWQRFVDTIRSYGINAGLGVVTEDLPGASQSFKDSLSNWHSIPDFEIWHHGWDHKRLNYPPDNANAGEFSGTPYEYQKDHLEDGMNYAQSELGITIRSFGAPYNQTDATLVTVLEENQDLKVWLYCNDSNYSGMCLSRGSNNKLESTTGVVSYSSFLNAYNSNVNPYLVLQGHPGHWDDQSYIEFGQIIDYLKAQGDCFVLPYEYYQIVNNVNVIYSEDFDDPDTLHLESIPEEIDATQGCCGELHIRQKEGMTLSQSDYIKYSLYEEASPATVDLSENKKVYIRLRSSENLDLRVDLSDGTNATSGINGQLVSNVNGNLDGWTVLTYDFPTVSLSESNVDASAISELRIYPNPNEIGFLGDIYIDYISFGDLNGSVAQCRTNLDPDPCKSVFEEQFDDGNVTISGSHLVNINASESLCGELKLEMKPESTLGTYKPILYTFPQPIDFTVNPRIVVRARCASSLPLRFDLNDGLNSTNGISGRVSNTIPADLTSWTEMSYEYSSLAFSENAVDSTAISRIFIHLDPSNENFPGPVYIDFISVGEPTGINNAINRTDLDDCETVNGFYDFHETGLGLYPNPTTGIVYLENQVSWKLLSTTGLVLNQGTSDAVDLSDYQPGTYFVITSEQVGRVTKQF